MKQRRFLNKILYLFGVLLNSDDVKIKKWNYLKKHKLAYSYDNIIIYESRHFKYWVIINCFIKLFCQPNEVCESSINDRVSYVSNQLKTRFLFA